MIYLDDTRHVVGFVIKFRSDANKLLLGEVFSQRSCRFIKKLIG